MPTLLPNLPEAAYDYASITVRGLPYDQVIDSLLAHLGPLATFKRKDKGLRTPKLAVIEVPDEPVLTVEWNSSFSDCYLKQAGPRSALLLSFAQQIDADNPSRCDKWPSTVRATRLDAKVDLCFPGAFKTLCDLAHEYHATIPKQQRPPIDGQGNWHQDNDHDLGTGRTRYFGNLKERTTLVRIYEKGKQLRDMYGVTDADPNLCRLEVEQHPTDAPAFESVYWSPADILSTSAIAVYVLTKLGHTLPTFHAARDSGTRSTTVKSLQALNRQYGPLAWKLAKRFDSAELAARLLAYTLLQPPLQPARLQKMLDKGRRAPELQADLFGWNDPSLQADNATQDA